MATKNLWNKTNEWSKELDALTQIIQKTELIPMKKWGGDVYTYNNKNVVGIAGFKNYFTVWFYNGVFLKDEAKKLVNAQEGITKSLRQWRFSHLEEIDESLLLHYIHEAINIAKAGKSIIPQKKEVVQSEFMEFKWRDLPELHEAFKNLTPYKQREYLEYIETAKQDKTKITRFEKIKPMILANIGLNDKYK